jgi:hypothetical protein
MSERKFNKANFEGFVIFSLKMFINLLRHSLSIDENLQHINTHTTYFFRGRRTIVKVERFFFLLFFLWMNKSMNYSIEYKIKQTQRGGILWKSSDLESIELFFSISNNFHPFLILCCCWDWWMRSFDDDFFFAENIENLLSSLSVQAKKKRKKNDFSTKLKLNNSRM